MPVTLTLDDDVAELAQSAILIKKHGWGSVSGVVTAHKITMVTEEKQRKI